MHIAQVSGENLLNSSHGSLKILLGEMFSRLRTSGQELGDLLSLLHYKLLRAWQKTCHLNTVKSRSNSKQISVLLFISVKTGHSSGKTN